MALQVSWTPCYWYWFGQLVRTYGVGPATGSTDHPPGRIDHEPGRMDPVAGGRTRCIGARVSAQLLGKTEEIQ